MISRAKIDAYVALTRLNRPIGIFLLLWPTLWALWFAAQGLPNPLVLLVFVLGVVIMRSAGCVINDFADRNFDGQVNRTKARPLALGLVKPKEALVLFAALIFIAFLLVLMTNLNTLLLSFVAVALAATYPFMKRYTYLPQVVLGAAFAWAIPMAYMASLESINSQAWLLFTATILWTVAYDTQYAMVDREDDLKVGIKSTAILFGENDRFMIAILQAMAVIALIMAGVQQESGLWFYLGLIGAVSLFFYQYRLTHDRAPAHCFQAFLNNNWVGAVIFLGIFLDSLF